MLNLVIRCSHLYVYIRYFILVFFFLINNLSLLLKQLGKNEKTKSQISRRKQIINIRAEINEIETKKIVAKINETKRWFFERINKVEISIASLIKKEGEDSNQ